MTGFEVIEQGSAEVVGSFPDAATFQIIGDLAVFSSSNGENIGAVKIKGRNTDRIVRRVVQDHN